MIRDKLQEVFLVYPTCFKHKVKGDGYRFCGLKNATLFFCAALLPSQIAFAQNEGGLSGASPPALPALTNVVTDTQVGSVGAATCAQQLNNLISGLDNAGLNKEYAEIGIASAAVLANQGAIIADGVGLGLEEASAGTPAAAIGIAAQIVAVGLSEVQVGLEAAALAAMAVGVNLQIDANEASQVAAGLPNCNSTFTGTVTVEAGGIDVTGNSQITGALGITGDLVATTGQFGEGVSAYNGQLTLGDADLDSFFAGITIGGGEFAGAGTGGDDAYTGDVDAIAIGNGSSASNAGSIAFGLRANSSAAGAVAIGTDSSASGASSVAFGVNSSATQDNAFALGTSAAATGVSSLALGNNAASSDDNATAIGTGSSASGASSVAFGVNSSATQDNAFALGTSAAATGVSSLAFGNNAAASGLNAIAIGTSSVASASNASSFGQGATSTFENSTAIGAGATTTVDNQLVIGTSLQSVTVPGITTAMSAQRQTGALSVATTDDSGNLAYDGGAIFTEIANNRQGVAIALATQIPDLVAGEEGAITFNFGRFKDATAVSIGGALVVNRDLYQMGDRITVNSALGTNLGASEFYTRKGNPVFGGRVGIQYSWQ